MADITVVVQVTPDPSSPTGFAWSYTPTGNAESFTITGPGTMQIPEGTSPEIQVNVVPGGQPSDTCVFQNNEQDPQQSPPLTYSDWQGNPVDDPQWYQGLQFLDADTIVFTDDNTNLKTRNYYITVNVIYTSGGIPVLTSSPDPTIVNVGTDGAGAVTFHFAVQRGEGSQEQAEPTAVAA